MISSPTILVDDILPKTTQNNIINAPFFHHPPSTPLSSPVNPAILVAHVIAHIATHLIARRRPLSTPTVVAQVIAHRHRRGSPPPPSSMSRQYEFNMSPETGPNGHPVTLHTSIVV
jgi:hypothetical protein